MSQLVVVVQVLVAQRDAEYALATSVLTWCSTNSAARPSRKQQTAALAVSPIARSASRRIVASGIRRHRTAVESTHNLTTLEPFKDELPSRYSLFASVGPP